MKWIYFETKDNSGRIEKHLIHLDHVILISEIKNPNSYGKDAAGVKIISAGESQTFWGISINAFKEYLCG